MFVDSYINHSSSYNPIKGMNDKKIGSELLRTTNSWKVANNKGRYKKNLMEL